MLYQKKIIPTALTLFEELREMGEIEQIGHEYIYGIIETAHTTAFAEHYAHIVKEKSTSIFLFCPFAAHHNPYHVFFLLFSSVPHRVQPDYIRRKGKSQE